MARVIVIGGGMSGLSFAWHLRRYRPEWEVMVLEKENRAGGKAWTVEEDGFLLEKGVNGVLDNKPSTVGLAAELGLDVLPSNDAARRRFVVKDGRLVKLPESPGEFLSSPLLSWRGRIRVVQEAFTPKGDLSYDESLAGFARRRLGEEAFRHLIDPMATGIYAGDPERLSLRSCFPRIYELERDHGSLIKAMLKLKREARARGDKGPGAGPGGKLVSFRGGMSELADRVCDDMGPGIVRCASEVVSLVENGRYSWSVELAGGESLEATHVVIACPAREASSVLSGAFPEISCLVRGIDYPPVAVVCFGMPKREISSSLDGFGFLVPGCEKRGILGTLWDSSLFSGRAPDGYALLRTLAGGARRRDIARLPDGKLVDKVFRELSELMGLRRFPDFVRVFRWQRAIPQYNQGHGQLMKDVSRLVSGHPGLYIRCNWTGGVSLNDCVANAGTLAMKL